MQAGSSKAFIEPAGGRGLFSKLHVSKQQGRVKYRSSLGRAKQTVGRTHW